MDLEKSLEGEALRAPLVVLPVELLTVGARVGLYCDAAGPLRLQNSGQAVLAGALALSIWGSLRRLRARSAWLDGFAGRGLAGSRALRSVGRNLAGLALLLLIDCLSAWLAHAVSDRLVCRL